MSEPRRGPSSRAARPNVAVRAEPRSVGSAGAHDPLAREVRLLGALLGQVIVEQEGESALDLVERVRRRTIALRRDPDPALRAALDADLATLGGPEIATLARAFSTYFQLVNLAEEKERVRQLRRRARTAGRTPMDDTLDEAVILLRRGGLSRDADRRPDGRAAHLAGPDGAPDRGAATDGSRRAPARLRPAGPPGRPAPDARRRHGGSPPSARGDHAPVAHRRPSPGAPDPARRGPLGDGVLRRDPLHGDAGPLPRGGRRARRSRTASRRATAPVDHQGPGRPPTWAGRGRARPQAPRSWPGAPGSAAIATATRT